MLYCTPKRFRYSALGISLAGLTDLDLRSTLVRAANRVNAFCTVPTEPQSFSFRGGTMIGEKHGWTDWKARRVYLTAHPIRSVEKLRVDATNNLFVDFQTNELYVNEHEGYVEIINFAITKAGIWGEANVPQLGLSQPVAIVDYTYGYRFAVVGEEAYPLPTVSGETAAFQEYLAENGFWASDVTPVVKKNGVEQASGVTFDRDTGLVRFDTPLASSDEVTLDYTYTIPSDVVEGNNLIAVALLGERSLAAKGLTGIESIEVEEVRVRRIGSRSGAEKVVDVPGSAAALLDGYKFITVR